MILFENHPCLSMRCCWHVIFQFSLSSFTSGIASISHSPNKASYLADNVRSLDTCFVRLLSWYNSVRTSLPSRPPSMMSSSAERKTATVRVSRILSCTSRPFLRVCPDPLPLWIRPGNTTAFTRTYLHAYASLSSILSSVYLFHPIARYKAWGAWGVITRWENGECVQMNVDLTILCLSLQDQRPRDGRQVRFLMRQVEMNHTFNDFSFLLVTASRATS